MIHHRLTTRLPDGFNISDSSWFRTIRDIYNRHLYRLILSSIIGGMCMTVLLYTYNVITGGSVPALNFLVPFVFLALMLLHLQLTKNVGVTGPAVMLVAIIGLIVTSLFPGGLYTNLVIFFVFPVLVLQIRGTRKGAIWVGVFFFFMVATVLARRVYQPELPAQYTVMQLSLGVMAFVINFMLVYSGEKQHELYINGIIQNLVFDNVTSLPRREVMMNSIAPGKSYLLALININNFSDLGAMFGYELSDVVLQFVAKRLREGGEMLGYRSYRLRGNEYGLLRELNGAGIPEDESSIRSFLNEVIDYLGRQPMPWEGSEIRLAFRIGGTVVSYPTRQRALSQADMAVKDAKKLHVPVALFNRETDVRVSAIDAIMKFSILVDNKEKESYRAVFQPIIDVATGKIIWYESLLRVQNREGGYESPLTYLPVAKATGEDRAISHFMISRACMALELTGADVSVNISLADMLKEDFIKYIEECLGKIPKRRGSLIFEILESEELTDIEACRRFIERARALGCKIAIDDFGSGYSNFSNIAQLQVDIVKIDGRLIQRMRSDGQAHAIVDGITALCKKIGKLVVAEHVDCQELLSAVSSIGVDYVQGYHLGMPGALPVDPEIVHSFLA